MIDITNGASIIQVAVTMGSNMPNAKKPPLDPAVFFSTQLSLIEQERLAEVAEISEAISRFSPSQLQSRGLAVLNLTISSIRSGLAGKTWCPKPSKLTLVLWSLRKMRQREVQSLHMRLGQEILADYSHCYLDRQRKRKSRRLGKWQLRALYPESRKAVSPYH